MLLQTQFNYGYLTLGAWTKTLDCLKPYKYMQRKIQKDRTKLQPSTKENERVNFPLTHLSDYTHTVLEISPNVVKNCTSKGAFWAGLGIYWSEKYFEKWKDVDLIYGTGKQNKIWGCVHFLYTEICRRIGYLTSGEIWKAKGFTSITENY